MNVEIRRACRGDGGAVAELLYSSGVEMYDFVFGRSAVEKLRHEFLSGMGFAGHPNVTVAVRRGHVVGTACLFDSKQYERLVSETTRATFAFFGPLLGLGPIWRSRYAAAVLTGPTDGELYLSNFSVAADLRGRGIGTRMLHHALDSARIQGCRRFGLDVLVSNPRAEALYSRLGMTAATERRRIGIPPVRKMEMAL